MREHEREEIADHPVVVKNGLVAEFPLRHENVGEDFQANGFYLHIAFALPCLEHLDEMRDLSRRCRISLLQQGVLGNRVGQAPLSPIGGVGNQILAVQRSVGEPKCGGDVDVVGLEGRDDHLPVRGKVGVGKGDKQRSPHFLEQLGLLISSERLDARIQVPRQDEEHVEISRGSRRGALTVGPYLDVARRVEGLVGIILREE